MACNPKLKELQFLGNNSSLPGQLARKLTAGKTHLQNPNAGREFRACLPVWKPQHEVAWASENTDSGGGWEMRGVVGEGVAHVYRCRYVALRPRRLRGAGMLMRHKTFKSCHWFYRNLVLAVCYRKSLQYLDAHVKKPWIYISTPPYVFIVYCLISSEQGQFRL
jgi:hypothetical protein